MTREQFYQLPVAPRPPETGDLIRTNYGLGLSGGYRVQTVYYRGGVYSFTCTQDHNPREQFYLNNYHFVAGRLVGTQVMSPGSSGWISIDGGLNSDGYTEIRIEQASLQPSLFSLLASE